MVPSAMSVNPWSRSHAVISYSVRRPAGEDRQDDALQRALEHLGRLFTHEALPATQS